MVPYSTLPAVLEERGISLAEHGGTEHRLTLADALTLPAPGQTTRLPFDPAESLHETTSGHPAASRRMTRVVKIQCLEKK